jgi:hypothetical protein
MLLLLRHLMLKCALGALGALGAQGFKIRKYSYDGTDGETYGVHKHAESSMKVLL